MIQLLGYKETVLCIAQEKVVRKVANEAKKTNNEGQRQEGNGNTVLCILLKDEIIDRQHNAHDNSFEGV